MSVPKENQDMADAMVKEAMQEIAADAEGWKEVSKANDITVWKKAGDGAIMNVRGRTTIKGPAATVLALYLDGDRAKELDPSLITSRDVEKFDAHNAVVYESFKGLAIVSGRDFCTLSAQRCLEDGTLVSVAKSVEHEKCPEEKKMVRAEIALHGFIVKSTGDTSCTVDYLTMVNLKGKIPAWVKNKLADEEPLVLGLIRKIVEAEYAEIALKIKPGETPVYAA